EHDLPDPRAARRVVMPRDPNAGARLPFGSPHPIVQVDLVSAHHDFPVADPLRLEDHFVLPAANGADEFVSLEPGHLARAEPPADALAVVLGDGQLLTGREGQA